MRTQGVETADEKFDSVGVQRHEVEAPELTLEGMFYPLGYPTLLRTNCEEVLGLAEELWSHFEWRVDAEPIRVDLHVVDGLSTVCPPTPVHRILLPLMVGVADEDNYIIANLDESRTQICVSRAALRHTSYFSYFFLAGAPLAHMVSRHGTAIHAGCVSLDGQGVLLCGDSGAGKSALSFACARAGWSYTTDDASYLLDEGPGVVVTGNFREVRFRPSAAELFPEIAGLEVTPRAVGKPSVRFSMEGRSGLVCRQTAKVKFVVFLNREGGGAQELAPFSKDAARRAWRTRMFGSAESLRKQYAIAEKLLVNDVFELRYSDLDWAVRRLEALVRAGR